MTNAVEAKQLDCLDYRVGWSMFAGMRRGAQALASSDVERLGELANFMLMLVAGQPKANQHVGLN
jgi:hypothetical protein